MAVYNHGDLVRLTAKFATLAGTPIDPDEVFVQVKLPDNTIRELKFGADPEVVRDSAGVYHYDLSLDVPGQYFYRWYSTGMGQAADWSGFTVRSSPFAS
jgi:hypothetical protein